jgi:RNA polymerase sigma factor (sigma-70 family)
VNPGSVADAPFDYVPRDLHDAVERWLPRMRKMAAAWALSHEVDDLLQDIWLELHRSWAVVIGAHSPLAMALEIAKRRCHKTLRKKKAVLRSPLLQAELPGDEPAARAARQSDPERQAAISQDVSSLHAILATLGERQRDAFLCRRVHGMTGEETAQVLKTTLRAAYALEEEARMKIEAEWRRRKHRMGRDGL